MATLGQVKILLTGTAGPRGWPEPGCRCASCRSLADGVRRSPLALTVDGRPVDPAQTLVTGAAGERLLNTTGEGPWPAGPPYDAVLVDPVTAPTVLARLRRDGMVTESTHVLAVRLDHRTRSADELARRSALWGARVVRDGTEVDTAQPPPARTPPPLRTLLLGGSRSGKSAEAELRLAAEPYVTYVATGPAGEDDPAWRARVAAHRVRRPAHWATAETTDLTAAIAEAETPLLVDGIGSWLATVRWREPERAADRCDELLAAWRETPQPIVAVSDEVGLGVIPASAVGRDFRDALGQLNQRLAEASEQVALVVAGRVMTLQP